MIVVKVGGSLFDHPGLGPGLRAFAETLDGDVLLVPGGGGVADAVRELDRVHGLGEEVAHRLALRSLDVTAALLEGFTSALRLVGGTSPRFPPAPPPASASRLNVLDCYRFALADPALPHTWAVTTDSIAARAAVMHRASRLILLKSIDIPDGTPWPVAAANGWVDAHFPSVVAGTTFPIQAINFRAWMERRSPG